jgi:hypothetical protein
LVTIRAGSSIQNTEPPPFTNHAIIDPAEKVFAGIGMSKGIASWSGSCMAYRISVFKVACFKVKPLNKRVYKIYNFKNK